MRKISKNILLVFISIIFALGICEVVLRFHNPLGFRIKGDNIILPRNRQEIIYHEGAGKLERVVIHQKNSLGFRGAEPPPDWGNWLSIITVGGSTTECFDLPENQSWPHLLGTKLQADGQRTWINNAGFCGYSTFGHLILMKDFIIKLHPQVVIFLTGINDIGLSGAKEYDARLKSLNFRSLERFLASLANYSELSAALVNIYRYYFPKSVMAVAARDMGEIDLKTYQHVEATADTRFQIKKLHQERFVPAYAGRIRELIAICKANGIDPVCLTQPALYGNVTDDLTGIDLRTLKVTPDMNGAIAWEVLELYNEVIREVGKSAGILVIDLAQELPKSSRYYYDLMHYTHEGSERVAEIIRAHLSPYLAGKYPADTQMPPK